MTWYMLQDWDAVTQLPEHLAMVNTVALIVWDVFEARFGWGQCGTLMLLMPLGCALFCGLHAATSAASYVKSDVSCSSSTQFSNTHMTKSTIILDNISNLKC